MKNFLNFYILVTSADLRWPEWLFLAKKTIWRSGGWQTVCVTSEWSVKYSELRLKASRRAFLLTPLELFHRSLSFWSASILAPFQKREKKKCYNRKMRSLHGRITMKTQHTRFDPKLGVTSDAFTGLNAFSSWAPGPEKERKKYGWRNKRERWGGRERGWKSVTSAVSEHVWSL